MMRHGPSAMRHVVRLSRSGRPCSRRAAAIVGVLLLTALALSGCGDDHAAERPRVLLIGIDGASLRLLEPLLEQRRLPNLARLRAEGVSGPLESLLPLQSPRIWNSIATGKTPDKHGITSFARVAEDRSLHLFLGSDRKVHALWNIVSDAGLSVGVVNWWNTFPPEKINGVMISDHIQEHEIQGREEIALASDTPRGTLVFPESWKPKLERALAVEEAPIEFDDPFAGNAALPHANFIGEKLSDYFRDDGAVLRLALEVEAEVEPDVLLVFFPGIDRVSHFLWGMIEPVDRYPESIRQSPEAREAGRIAFERYYEYTDALLGALIARFGRDDLIMVVSDHGFEAGVELGMLTGVHKSEEARDGIIFARGPGIPRDTAAGAISVLDITPTLLAWLGIPVGADMDGNPASFLATEPVPRIASHDTTPVERLETASSGSDERILEDLRALGYLEEEEEED